ncbi:MAG: hypothetical protein WD712_01650 [Candidatus Spechtbacterales bacterium]
MPTKQKGLFIVIDGIDGTGKTTQVERIKELALGEGYDVRVADFPRYGEKSAGPVELYLTGELGTADGVGPYRASVLFAVDRYCFASQLREWLEAGYLVLSNRYVASNLGHQGGKIDDKTERDKFWQWTFDLEYKTFGIPRPDINFILNADPSIAYELVAKKGERAYLKGQKRDLHEQDMEHLRRSSESYLSLAEKFPREFEVINCSRQGDILPIPEITNVLWERVKSLLKNNQERRQI